MTSRPAPQWRKSSYSNGTGGECVEVAEFSVSIGVRDSKMTEGTAIAVSRTAWAGFVAAVRHQALC